MHTKIGLVNGGVTLISQADYELLRRFPWKKQQFNHTGNYYVRMHGAGPLMARIIMEAKPGEIVDHVNGDTLDNRRENLRIVTKSQNMQNKDLMKNNTSGFPGVSWHKGHRTWYAYINKDGKRKYLGDFKIKEDAIEARQKATEEIYGEYTHHRFRKPPN